jgi:hypothetical protein
VNAETPVFTTGSFSSYAMSTPMRRTRSPCINSFHASVEAQLAMNRAFVTPSMRRADTVYAY